MPLNSRDLVKKFKMLPHPEGGYYSEQFRSSDMIKGLPERYDNSTRVATTSIYYLLQKNDFSSFHALKSDETWHFYGGSPVLIHTITKEGEHKTHRPGNPLNHENSEPQITILHETYFAAEVEDKADFSFVGCTVSPGFEFEDFRLVSRYELTKQLPNLSKIIEKFTREENR